MPMFIDHQYKFTLEEKRILKFHNNREYIVDFLREGHFYAHDSERYNDRELQAVQQRIINVLQAEYVKIINELEMFSRYHETIAKLR